jgi:hypothetical protein
MSLQPTEITIPNVKLSLEQLLMVIRQLDKPSRIQVAQVLAETDMDAKLADLIKRLSEKSPVQDISMSDIQAEVKAVRYAENRY